MSGLPLIEAQEALVRENLKAAIMDQLDTATERFSAQTVLTDIDWDDEHYLGIRMHFQELPEDVAQAVRTSYEERMSVSTWDQNYQRRRSNSRNRRPRRTSIAHKIEIILLFIAFYAILWSFVLTVRHFMCWNYPTETDTDKRDKAVESNLTNRDLRV